MCHLVLSMPVLGLVVFWLWPLPIAIPVYAAILAVSAVVYKAMMTAMRRPSVTGREGMLHEIGEIVGTSPSEVSVRIHGELWRARATDALKPHDLVEVIDVQGLTLHVAKAELARR